MKVLSKDVVMSDIEAFLAQSQTAMLLREYAESKGWDPVLFREFMDKLKDYSYAPSNHITGTMNVGTNEIKSTVPQNELHNKKTGPQTRGNRNLNQFSLSDEDLVKFSVFVDYYSNKSKAFDYANDVSSAQRNSPETFNIYWKYKPKTIPEDKYNETRYENFPYLMEMAQGSNHSYPAKFVEVPERYKKETYYVGTDGRTQVTIETEIVDGHQIGEDHPISIGDKQKRRFFKLIPTSAETPFYDYVPYMPYTYDPIHNHIPSGELEWEVAMQKNVIGDGFVNSNPNLRQGK